MIIGITGPTGSGKDTAASFIEKEFNFQHVSGGDILREFLTQIGFEPKKEAVGDLGTLLRNNYGADAILGLVLARAKKGNVVNSGFRSPEEARLIKKAGGYIIYVDAPETTRYARVLERSREGESMDAILAIEKKESQSDNKLAESLVDVYSIADVIVTNDSSIDNFYAKIKDVVKSLMDADS